MFDLFKRIGRPGATMETIAAGLGAQVVACPLQAGCRLPAGTVGVAVDGAGHTRRTGATAMAGAQGRFAPFEGESGWCFHPGPYACDLLPFAAAPEIGLHVDFVVDSPDPRFAQQRFDLFLASEASGTLGLADLTERIEAALQRELAQGNLELPPCTTLDEWNAFRGGFNRLLYTRFGLSVEDCVPVDLGASRDYACLLRERAAKADAGPAAAPPGQPVPETAGEAGRRGPADPAREDARALRRLFLELPPILCGVRQAALPSSQALFRRQQALLARLDLASLAAATMPALGLAAPGRLLGAGQQARRASHSVRAATALDEAWALLARLGRAGEGGLAPLFDELDRIVANLEHDLEARRSLSPVEEAA